MPNLLGTQGADNLGAIWKAKYGLSRELSSRIRPNYNKEVTAAPAMTAGGATYDIDFKLFSSHFKEITGDSPHGALTHVDLVFFIPYTRKEKNAIIERFKTDRFFIIWTDMNNFTRITGNKDSGLHLKITENVADRVDGENGYLLEFYGDFPNRSYAYTA